ncbi:hypothetical protein [Bradyrhizobium sp. CCGUVB23]|uniref:hypothetical protein n=1 Tax=Bradyrhizobium sp. CCGUVB23 TaxID=2949630 RepID=UPI0020B45518|nr:hypothetical protein [Bradyrhizobium sp. CCGUVB23]MCP3467647.1 hypothetical protein [Bradyrhizobium sp. CCGUVB23]
METIRWIISTAPEIFLLSAVALVTILGRIKIREFAIGTTAYRVTIAAGLTVGSIEEKIGSRTVLERIVRKGSDVKPQLQTVLEAGDDIVLAGRSATILAADPIIVASTFAG